VLSGHKKSSSKAEAIPDILTDYYLCVRELVNSVVIWDYGVGDL